MQSAILSTVTRLIMQNGGHRDRCFTRPSHRWFYCYTVKGSVSVHTSTLLNTTYQNHISCVAAITKIDHQDCEHRRQFTEYCTCCIPALLYTCASQRGPIASGGGGGSVPNFLRKPIVICDFLKGSGPLVPLPLDPPMVYFL